MEVTSGSSQWVYGFYVRVGDGLKGQLYYWVISELWDGMTVV